MKHKTSISKIESGGFIFNRSVPNRSFIRRKVCGSERKVKANKDQYRVLRTLRADKTCQVYEFMQQLSDCSKQADSSS